MREIGRADANRREAAEAAARLQNRFLTDVPDKFAKERPGAHERLFAGLLDLPAKSREPAKSADTPSELLRSAEVPADRPSASKLINKVLQNPRRTRDELQDCLALVSRLHVEAAVQEIELIEAARDARLSWIEIAAAQKLSSRQAAEQRYKRLKGSVSSLLENETATPKPDKSEPPAE